MKVKGIEFVRVGANTRVRREARKWSRPDMCREANGRISVRALAALELGETLPHPATVYAIADVLNVSVDELIADADVPENGSAPDESGALPKGVTGTHNTLDDLTIQHEQDYTA